MFIIKFILARVLCQGKIHGEANSDRVRCYEKQGELADYVFSAKQRPKRSSSALMMFSFSVGIENS